jgi:hypothetical protein
MSTRPLTVGTRHVRAIIGWWLVCCATCGLVKAKFRTEDAAKSHAIKTSAKPCKCGAR